MSRKSGSSLPSASKASSCPCTRISMSRNCIIPRDVSSQFLLRTTVLAQEVGQRHARRARPDGRTLEK